MDMTPREKFIAALERKPITGRVPHFELVFYPTMEAFGKLHPRHRNFVQWDQMEEKERQLHRNDIAQTFIQIAETYDHNAIFLTPNPDTLEETIRLIDLVREKSGDKFYLTMHGDATFAIPHGDQMMEFCYRLADEPDKVKQEAQDRVDRKLEWARRLADHGGLDGFTLCSDYCFNQGPFLSPNQFSEFISPYLAKLIQGYRDLGFYVIKHTDGNIEPIVDQLVQSHPHALHSL
ncbi:MAG: hypothetical protein KC917_10405, partial [Candidatus Omnitrophica bacterium]|nr:hypothetical protein [Candidatus Omnitrophota bacterium]